MSAFLNIRVGNIHCEGCAGQVRTALEALAGVEKVGAINVADGLVEVRVDDEVTSREALAKVLEESGLPAAGRPHTADDRTDDEDGGRESATLRFGLLAGTALLLGLLGYIGYEVYPRFDMRAVDGVALLTLAAAAGIASFFSPCAFSLLLTIVGRQGGGFVRPFRFAAGVSLGATIFVLLLGAMIALGGRALVGSVVFTSAEGRTLRALVGLVLVALGLLQAGLLPNPLHAIDDVIRPRLRLQAEQRRKRPQLVGSTLFGFSYLLAGFG